MRCFSKLLLVCLCVSAVSYAHADAFVVTAANPGVQVPPAGLTYETFNSRTAGTNLSGTYTTNFGGSQYTGTYSGTVHWYGADQYGGAGGTGVYPEVFSGQSYTINITPQTGAPAANYFGLWFSALDPGNHLDFYRGNTLLYSFTPQAFINLVGACPNTYCGNPNSNYLGSDRGEQFAFLNFWDTNGSFDKIVVGEGTNFGGGFESDNHTVAHITGNPGGIAVTPEPGTFLMVGGGLLAAAGAMRRKLAL